MTVRKKAEVEVVIGCIGLLLISWTIVYAVKMFGVAATVDEIDLDSSSMKATYADPDTNETKTQALFWDESTEIIKQGPPPDMEESQAKPGDIKKGSRVYMRIVEGSDREGKLRLDKVRIKP